jgi:DNA-binding NarL/FixJ family response regulator
MPRIRVLLADDHPLFRRGVADLLRAEGSFEVVGEAGDGRQAVELARSCRPDVVLMDVAMPGMDGLGATRRIAAELPEVKVVMGSALDEGERSTAAAAAAGAVGFVSNLATPQALYDALRDAASESLSRA